MIDLRSDTVTQPTDAMRRAMAAAEVGDDVYGEDPTVNALQECGAALVGKEAALFVPSGTMGNQVAIAVHAPPGSEVICEARAHVIEYEMAAMAVISGCMPRPVSTSDGILRAPLIEGMLRPARPGLTRPGLILVENTHNMASGAVTPPSELAAIADLARRERIPVHMDGARIFNAALASGVEAMALAAHADSIMFCLSKGLCAPVGSLLAGEASFVNEARRWRKRLGGGMRQAGVLAAAGLVGLKTMRQRLGEDHEMAGALARGLGDIEGLTLDVPILMTNIVYVKVRAGREAQAAVHTALRQQGVLCNAVAPDRLRFVTHHGIGRPEIESALEVTREAMARLPITEDAAGPL